MRSVPIDSTLIVHRYEGGGVHGLHSDVGRVWYRMRDGTLREGEVGPIRRLDFSFLRFQPAPEVAAALRRQEADQSGEAT